jgi:hypothetical protein
MFSIARKFLMLALAVAALLSWQAVSDVAVHAQDKPAAANVTVKDFAGTWNLMFEDKRFATMILQLNGDQLTGSITNGTIEMDDNGKITSASGKDGSSPIVRTSLADGVLRVVEKDGSEDMEWSMTLTSPTTGELRMSAAGAPPSAQAIKLEKVWSEPPVQP